MITNISVGVFICEAFKHECVIHQQTHLTNIKNYIFYGCQNDSSIPVYGPDLPINDDFDSTTPKQFLCLKKQYDLHKDECDWYYVCGHDTYLHPYNAAKALTFFKDPKNIPYFVGGHGDLLTINNLRVYFASGGPGFFLSKKCLELLYPKIETYIEEWKNISQKGCYYAACDVAIAYFIKRDLKLACSEIPGFYFYNYDRYETKPILNKEHHNRYKLIDAPISFHKLLPPTIEMLSLHKRALGGLIPFAKSKLLS